MTKVVIILLVSLLLVGCANNSSPTPSIGSATICKVSFLNSAKSGDELLKEITAPSEVASLASYADKQISNASTWCHLVHVGDRTANLFKVSFYDGDTYKGTLGLGFYEEEKFFLKYHSFGVSRVICISNKEKGEFLKQLGISEEEEKRLFNR